MKNSFDSLRTGTSWDSAVSSVFSEMLSGYVHESRFLHTDDSAAHKIVRASHGFASVFGCTIEDYNAAGLWGGRYLPEEESAALERARALRRGMAVHADVRLRGSDGQWRWLYTKNRPITDPHMHRVIGVIGVGQDITERRRDEERSRRHLGRDTDPAPSAHRPMACTLHHGVAQDLADAALMLSAAAARQDHVSIAEAIERINRAMCDAQTMATDLSSLVAADEGLASALTLLVEDLRRVHQSVEIDLKLLTAKSPLALPFNVENHLYHIAREALYNALKHSRSSVITLTLQCGRAGICLTVQDHGTGVAPEDVAASTRGLRLMAQRADLLGARLSVVGRPAQGTRVICRLPVGTIAASH